MLIVPGCVHNYCMFKTFDICNMAEKERNFTQNNLFIHSNLTIIIYLYNSLIQISNLYDLILKS